MVTSNPKRSDVQPEIRDDGWEVSGLQQADLDAGVLGNVVQELETVGPPDFHSLLVARNGKLAFERYFHGYDSDRLHDIRSAGKSFTSTLIGIAIDQGAIPGIDSPALPFFRRYEPIRNRDHRKEAIRVRDLLAMRSGLDADDNDPATPGCEDNMLRSDDWVRYSLDLPMTEAPGRRWVYAGPNSVLLAGLLESATERPVLDFAIDHLFEPLDFGNVLWESAPNGAVAGQGFLSLCGRDMLKLGQLFLDDGVWRGRRIVSEQWVRAATECRVELPGDNHPGYGYQWWTGPFTVDSKSIACFFASGNGGNKIFVLPSLDMVVATASSAYNQPYMHARSHRVLAEVIRAAM